MTNLNTEGRPIPDFVKFMSSDKSLIDDMLEKSDPSRATLLDTNNCQGEVKHVAYRYDKTTGLCTAVIRVK